MKGWKITMYKGIMGNTGIVIEESEAFEYALENIKTDELKEEFVEWFFSGNWIKEPEND